VRFSPFYLLWWLLVVLADLMQLGFLLSMIFSENRFPLFRIML
jgi:hypothetical protein